MMNLVQCYSSTLRETGETFLPMVGGVAAVLVNLVFNYILIFGNFGAPKLGIAGAAIATVMSRFVELAVVVIWTRMKAKENPFIIGAFRSAYVPLALIKQIALKGFPLMPLRAGQHRQTRLYLGKICPQHLLSNLTLL